MNFLKSPYPAATPINFKVNLWFVFNCLVFSLLTYFLMIYNNSLEKSLVISLVFTFLSLVLWKLKKFIFLFYIFSYNLPKLIDVPFFLKNYMIQGIFNAYMPIALKNGSGGFYYFYYKKKSSHKIEEKILSKIKSPFFNESVLIVLFHYLKNPSSDFWNLFEKNISYSFYLTSPKKFHHILKKLKPIFQKIGEKNFPNIYEKTRRINPQSMLELLSQEWEKGNTQYMKRKLEQDLPQACTSLKPRRL